jgi:hypothetical protein
MSEAFDAYVLEEPDPAVLRQLSERDLPDAELAQASRRPLESEKWAVSVTPWQHILYSVESGVALVATVTGNAGDTGSA